MGSPYRHDGNYHAAKNYLIQSEAAARMASEHPVVYVVQDDPRKNVVGALDFGSVEPLLQQDEELSMLNTPRIVAKIQFGLQKMRPIDYILPIGNPVSIGIAFAVASEVTGGEFKALKWDPQEKRYFAVTINLNPSR